MILQKRYGPHVKEIYKNLSTLHSVGKFDNLIDKQFFVRVTCWTILTISLLSNTNFSIFQFSTTTDGGAILIYFSKCVPWPGPNWPWGGPSRALNSLHGTLRRSRACGWGSATSCRSTRRAHSAPLSQMSWKWETRTCGWLRPRIHKVIDFLLKSNSGGKF